MAANIKEVALAAGVSSATVSHVINGTRFVSEATRAKVQRAIEELQYSPNILARAFATGSRDTVGFVVPDIANGYFATLIEQVEDVLQTHGYRLIVSNTRENPIRELDSLRMLSSGVVDGLLLASTLDDYSEVADALPPGFPVVLIDRSLAHAPVDTITTHNADAMRKGVSALIEAGHRRIGFMASVRHLSTTTERVGAYCDALLEHRIPVDPDLILYLETMTEPIQPAAEKLRAEGCTAIVASNNVLTSKLLAVTRAPGWTGNDFEMLGYSDPTHPAEMTGESGWLEEPVSEMGRLAAETIVHRLLEPSDPVRATALQAKLSTSDSIDGRSL